MNLPFIVDHSKKRFWKTNSKQYAIFSLYSLLTGEKQKKRDPEEQKINK